MLDAIIAFFSDEMFWCGVVGILGAEVFTLLNCARRSKWPKHVKTLGYWAIWPVACFFAGFLASRVVEATTPLMAAWTGAAAPLIFQRLTEESPP